MPNKNLAAKDKALIENLKARSCGEVVRYIKGKVVALTKKEDERLVVIACRLGLPIDKILA